MEIDRTNEKKLIQTVLGYSIGIRPSMNYILEDCAKLQDSVGWKKITGLNFEKEIPIIQQWLTRTLTVHPPSDNIQAYWFGICNPVLNDGETSCDLYVSGSPVFNAEDGTAEWARLREDSYLPEGCYAKSGILDQMYYLIHHYEGAVHGEFLLCLGYACLAVKAALSVIDQRFLFGKYGPRPIAVGLDKGDFIFITVKYQ